MEEIWRDITDYEGLYQVSNFGRVKSLERDVIISNGNIRHQEEKMLKYAKDKYGYLRVDICKNGKRKTMLIHRLVASVFLDNPNNCTDINHKNEDKTNNCVSNLEWCDRKYNINYGTRNERAGISNINNPKKSKTVFQYSLDGTLVKEWESTKECGRNGFNSGNVAACCNNKHNRKGNNIYKGFKWSYFKI